MNSIKKLRIDYDHYTLVCMLGCANIYGCMLELTNVTYVCVHAERRGVNKEERRAIDGSGEKKEGKEARE